MASPRTEEQPARPARDAPVDAAPVAGVAQQRGSLRSELLFNLSFLGGAALLLALYTTNILHLPLFSGRYPSLSLGIVVAVDLAIFIGLASFLIDRLVMRPLADTAAAAEAIAGGDYDRRVPIVQTREMNVLGSSLNRLTDQLLRNQSRLAENVQSLNETNRRLLLAQQDLVQAEKLASIGRLAAGVAHEIGNPLGAMMGYHAVLRRRGADPELIGGMDREAKRIDRIVRSLLDYARPAPAVSESTDINASVTSTVEMIRSQGVIDSVDVHLELEPRLPLVKAVPHHMDQIFVNLLTNAVAAMNGEGELRIVSSRGRYRPTRYVRRRRADDPPGIDYSHLRRLNPEFRGELVRLTAGDDVVRVTVADNGPGISEEHLGQIFDPFFTTRAPGEGTGLGLAIVASTVAEIGGRIEVASMPGEGAVFTLTFPLQSPEA